MQTYLFSTWNINAVISRAYMLTLEDTYSGRVVFVGIELPKEKNACLNQTSFTALVFSWMWYISPTLKFS